MSSIGSDNPDNAGVRVGKSFVGSTKEKLTGPNQRSALGEIGNRLVKKPLGTAGKPYVGTTKPEGNMKSSVFAVPALPVPKAARNETKRATNNNGTKSKANTKLGVSSLSTSKGSTKLVDVKAKVLSNFNATRYALIFICTEIRSTTYN